MFDPERLLGQLLADHGLKGLKPVYWDDGWNGKDGFQLFDRNTAAVTDADSIRALTGGVALPPP